ncbi:hypothetical protein Sjap_009531 [Stephania japonica]|uniref:Fungal lipase-type domain-containing protein n=1 Tax=Stephania japonica TaxID=461633 RepID=A0AAP0PCC6_9MAGN
MASLMNPNPSLAALETSIRLSSTTRGAQPGLSAFARVAVAPAERKAAGVGLISTFPQYMTTPVVAPTSSSHVVNKQPTVNWRDTSSSSTSTSTSSSSSTTSTSASFSSQLARVWREIQGSNNWGDLMEPLNPLLRDEIVRYGEFVTACYKAFDLDPTSRRYLNCKYGKKNMLKEVGMENPGYEITKYIYANPDISIPTQIGTCCSRWIGYVAVSSDEESKRLGRRDVLITFRGTVTNTEWIANFMSSLTPARLDPHNPLPEVKVESGFLNLYTSDDRSCKFGVGSCRQQLLSEVSRILNMYKGEEMSITLAGHSMGSSLAVLLGYDIAELGMNKRSSTSTNTSTSCSTSNRDENREIPVTVYSFGGPRVGNSSFKNRCEELGVKVLRVVNINDPVTKMPGVLFSNENFRALLGDKLELPWMACSCYAHVGVELALDFFKMQNPSCVHDLETYIGLVRTCNMKAQIQKDVADMRNKAWQFLFSAQVLVTLCMCVHL